MQPSQALKLCENYECMNALSNVFAFADTCVRKISCTALLQVFKSEMKKLNSSPNNTGACKTQPLTSFNFYGNRQGSHHSGKPMFLLLLLYNESQPWWPRVTAVHLHYLHL